MKKSVLRKLLESRKPKVVEEVKETKPKKSKSKKEEE